MSRRIKCPEADIRRGIGEQQRFETLLAEISTQFINLSTDRIVSLMEEVQCRVREFFCLDLSPLWQKSFESPRFLSMTHLYSPWENRKELVGQINGAELFPWQYQKMMQGETFSFFGSSAESVGSRQGGD